ncbi:MAG: hypothetical protein LKJ13_08070 [Clostridia bacterium]|jgi:septum site-determining protein MinC|nr:hypothetical protein [Clostridia bacterium]MCI1999944.1 hypothetical protein [Clostridia bacterium]MCI2014522.1 hypothetical protein [Clostridia bacterium]
MITFVTDKDRNEQNEEEPVGVTQTGTPVGKIVEKAEKAAAEEAEKAKEKETAEETKESKETKETEGNDEKADKKTDKDDAAEETEGSEKTDNTDKTKDKIEKMLFSINEHMALFHKGNLRNGFTLEYDGSIILLGDVNPGAEIKATGNILILGALKGVAHAGCNGEIGAFVFALNLIPVQLRIANIITRFPDGDSKEGRKPEYAYVEDGKIYVSPFE